MFSRCHSCDIPSPGPHHQGEWFHKPAQHHRAGAAASLSSGKDRDSSADVTAAISPLAYAELLGVQYNSPYAASTSFLPVSGLQKPQEHALN